MKKQPTLKQAKDAATRLHSLIVRHRNTHCQAASTGVLATPCRGPLQAAHIIPKRGTTQVRCDPDNGWTLCAGHHRVIDTRPDYWARLVMKTAGWASVWSWQGICEMAAEDGLWFGAGHCSPLMFWRATLDELIEVALQERVPFGALPVWVQDKARETATLMEET